MKIIVSQKVLISIGSHWASMEYVAITHVFNSRGLLLHVPLLQTAGGPQSLPGVHSGGVSGISLRFIPLHHIAKHDVYPLYQ